MVFQVIQNDQAWWREDEDFWAPPAWWDKLEILGSDNIAPIRVAGIDIEGRPQPWLTEFKGLVTTSAEPSDQANSSSNRSIQTAEERAWGKTPEYLYL